MENINKPTIPSDLIPMGVPVNAVQSSLGLDFQTFLERLTNFTFTEKLTLQGFMKPPLKYEITLGEKSYIKLKESVDQETTFQKYSSVNCKRLKIRAFYYPNGDSTTKFHVFTIYKSFTCCCNFKNYSIQVEMASDLGKFLGQVIDIGVGCYSVREEIITNNEEQLTMITPKKHTSLCCRGIDHYDIPFQILSGAKIVGNATKVFEDSARNIIGLVHFNCNVDPSLKWKQKLMAIAALVMVDIVFFQNSTKHGF